MYCKKSRALLTVHVLGTAHIKTVYLWNVTPCILVDNCQRFGEPAASSHFVLNIEAGSDSKKVGTYQVHGVTSQNNVTARVKCSYQ